MKNILGVFKAAASLPQDLEPEIVGRLRWDMPLHTIKTKAAIRELLPWLKQTFVDHGVKFLIVRNTSILYQQRPDMFEDWLEQLNSISHEAFFCRKNNCIVLPQEYHHTEMDGFLAIYPEKHAVKTMPKILVSHEAAHALNNIFECVSGTSMDDAPEFTKAVREDFTTLSPETAAALGEAHGYLKNIPFTKDGHAQEPDVAMRHEIFACIFEEILTGRKILTRHLPASRDALPALLAKAQMALAPSVT